MITSPGSESRRRYDDRYWHHLAATFGGGVLTVYVDGDAVAEAKGAEGAPLRWNATAVTTIG
eukprot:5603958-Pyramimonas_sp.AAC.1